MDEFEFGEHVDVAGAPDAVERVRSVTTGASGGPAKIVSGVVTALFGWVAYKYSLAGPWGGLLAFLTLLCIL
jgi:F0F1-type ATP synthase assembly protein I